MICQDINKSELWVFEEISRKLQNSKNSHKNFCPNFWDRHRGSFFLFFHPDNESSEKKTFAEGGYGSTVSYPTTKDFCEQPWKMAHWFCIYALFLIRKLGFNLLIFSLYLQFFFEFNTKIAKNCQKLPKLRKS